MSRTLKDLAILRDHFAKIPDTAVANLFRCITVAIEEVKSNLIEIDDSEQIEASKAVDDSPYEIFRSRLIEVILNDLQFMELIDPSNVQSFVHDCVTVYWEEKTKSFHASTYSTEKTIDFFVRWLYLINPDEEKSFKKAVHQDVWRFANLCTLLEYEQNELLSFYTACRVTENLLATSSSSFYTTLLDEKVLFRTKVREKLFVCMFQRLWRRMCRLVGQNEEDPQFWISQYTLISNYYPVEHAPQLDELKYMKDRLDFMHLTYLIFTHGQMFRPIILVRQLLNMTEIYKDTVYGQKCICLRKLPMIIDEILTHCQRQRINESTMMIDIQQWIIRLLKTSQEQSTQPEILSMFKILSRPNYSLSLPTKQFLFDELCSIQLDLLSHNQNHNNQSTNSFWDDICLLPIIVSCVDFNKIHEYQLPYHPCVVPKPNEHHILLDLYFFRLRRLSSEEFSGINLIHRIMESPLPAGIDPQYLTLSENVFNQLKGYFSLQLVATLVCNMDSNQSNQEKFDEILKEIINRYLSIDVKALKLNKHLEFFLSMIISKKSWTFLTDLLKSQRFQCLNKVWANTLHNLLPMDLQNQTKKTLRFCHKVQFAMHLNDGSSVFPSLHKPYHELQQLMSQCLQNPDLTHRWTPLLRWIKSKLVLQKSMDQRLREIKVMILLNIYYNYYCTNQLQLLADFITVLNSYLRLPAEELIIFRAFLQPKEFMVGYTDREDDPDKNFLNDLFHLTFADEDELPIRHTLVNLLAMILLGGKQSFLWPFAFDPSQLSETYGFGSLRSEPISVIVHYDCGCFLTETGALVFPPLGRGLGSLLNVPAVYVAYFATFGAMAWHLLLYKNSPETFYGPILAKHAIDSKNPAEGMNGDSLRARVCHFVRARIVSTNFFLVQKSNQDETCILLTRCFEQLASLSRESTRSTSWIKPVFKTHQERYEAEKGFQDQVFYPMYRKVPEDAKFIISLDLRSVIQKNLQEYISQLPVTIEFEHFKTELCNPKYSLTPLAILQYVLDSLDYLRIIRYINDLSRFHLLLHRTFSHLIEKDELFTISLQTLYERSRKYFARLRQADQSVKHWSIIQNGIEAVNGYHQFSGGQIRPGACEVTQGFQTISIETPVNYLVETDDFDAGNIIMRILTVLVSFHNHSVDLLEKEIVENVRFGRNDRELKRQIQSCVKREVSIFQIAQECNGVNAIDVNERRKIERLAQASLQNQRSYYLRSDTPLSFDYVPIQSHIIRTYLLHYRINYDHFQGQYQYYIKKNRPTMMNNGLSLPRNVIDPSLRAQWSHLEQMSLHRLQKELEFLQLIHQAIQKSHDKDLQQMSFSSFIHLEEYGDQFIKEYDEHQIQDFSLHSIGDICRLHEEMIDDYRSCFVNTPPGLRVTLERASEEQFDRNLKHAFLSSTEPINPDLIEERLKTLSDFIKDLKEAESMFDKQWSVSFRETCEILCFTSECYECIPPEIKGASFVPVCEKFIVLRSALYEEKLHQRKPKAVPEKIASSLQNTNGDNPSTDWVQLVAPVPLPVAEETVPTLKPKEPTIVNSSDPPNASTGRTTMSIVPTKSPFSRLLEGVHEKVKEMKSRKAQPRFILTRNGSQIFKTMVQSDKLHEKFRQIFQRRAFNPDHLSIVDVNYLAVDLSTDDSIRPTVEQYHVIDRSTLITIKINLEDTVAEYRCTSEANLSSVCSLFFLDHASIYRPPPGGYQFVDYYGQVLLDDYPIKNLDRVHPQEPIHIRIIPCDSFHDAVCEVTVKRNDQIISTATLSPLANGRQLLNRLLSNGTIPKPQNVEYELLWRNRNSFIDKNEPLVHTVLDGCPVIEVEIIDGLMNTDDLNQKDNQNRRVMLRNRAANASYDEGVRQSLQRCAAMLQQSRQIKVIWYDDQEKTQTIQLPQSRLDFTIQQMKALITEADDQHSLALTSTKKVLSDKMPVTMLKEGEIYLVKNFRTCSIVIQQADTITNIPADQSNKPQRYIIDATLHNVCKQNPRITADRHILYNKEFVLSRGTPLSMLISDETTPIQLVVVKKQLPATVTITWDEQDRPIKFSCRPSIIVRHIKQILENCWSLSEGFYCLATNSGCGIDDDTSLSEALGTCDDVQLRVALLFEEKCIVTFYNRKMILPIMPDTLGYNVFNEAIKRFHIPQNDRSLWTLLVMDDPQFPTEMDLDQPIADVYEFLPKDKSPIPFQLTRCDHELRN